MVAMFYSCSDVRLPEEAHCIAKTGLVRGREIDPGEKLRGKSGGAGEGDDPDTTGKELNCSEIIRHGHGTLNASTGPVREKTGHF
jgi:hypothetical protein